MLGLEPRTSSSRTTRATKLRHTPQASIVAVRGILRNLARARLPSPAMLRPQDVPVRRIYRSRFDPGPQIGNDGSQNVETTCSRLLAGQRGPQGGLVMGVSSGAEAGVVVERQRMLRDLPDPAGRLLYDG